MGLEEGRKEAELIEKGPVVGMLRASLVKDAAGCREVSRVEVTVMTPVGQSCAGGGGFGSQRHLCTGSSSGSLPAGSQQEAWSAREAGGLALSPGWEGPWRRRGPSSRPSRGWPGFQY